MWESVELREIRVFLALAEELHFGRAAEKLGLTQSRVSQSLRQLEGKVGGQLLHRTSRRVSLTPLGERFRERVGGAYRQLAEALQASPDTGGTLRLGTFEPCSAGPHLNAIIARFEAAHPDCEVQVSEISHGTDPLDALRRGEVRLLAIRLPLVAADLAVGPVLTREPRVLAVARTHPLAARASVTLEDVADYRVTECFGVPRSIMRAFVPAATAGGRPLQRIPNSPVKPYEVASLVARGKVVHPTVPSFDDFFGQPEITYRPLTDLPPLESALVSRRDDPDPRVAGFLRVAAEVLSVS
ncbi:LysR family transcriptional regulator [Pseudonocardia eucalypti]|uniref:LysR family transcriptional regulator n=1 Tax=Pseudonocardia eucalypti TaxID=648755 RepID=A0ABP9PXS5_9PSEU|nr:DNA-binding transcriptional LysR family regulator [Pseudonocardia eucalypti]